MNNCPLFISKHEWLPNSPDLNVVDFCIWSVLLKKAWATPSNSVIILKQRLVKALSEIDQSILHSSVEGMPCILRAVIKAKEYHF